MPLRSAVIVVSSLVVRGSVGSRATMFVLERLGFPVWAVPTVILPWHPGHGPGTRIAPANDRFSALIADLCGSPKLAEVGGVLSGYLADAGQAGAVARLVAAVKAANPSAIYLCDPIIGDSDGLFQPAAIAAAIRDTLLPRADIATPNRYELEWMAGRPLADNRETVAAAQALGSAETVVTSAHTAADAIGNLLVNSGEALLASHARLPEAPHGTGDLFAALYFGHRLDGDAPAAALERATATTFALIGEAVARGDDELPLAAAQARFNTSPAGVSLARLSFT